MISGKDNVKTDENKKSDCIQPLASFKLIKVGIFDYENNKFIGFFSEQSDERYETMRHEQSGVQADRNRLPPFLPSSSFE